MKSKQTQLILKSYYTCLIELKIFKGAVGMFFNILQPLLDDPTFKAKVKYLTKTYHANEKILEQGKPHNALYLIKKGQ
jgi:hypothetical protein